MTIVRAFGGPRDGEIVPPQEIVATQDWRGYLFTFDEHELLVTAVWRGWLARATST